MVNIKESLIVKENKLILATITAVPVWLFSMAITSEGFPSPFISGPSVYFIFFLAIFSLIFFFLTQWMSLHLVIYSLTPLLLVGFFDEITTHYKTPFIFLCGLILSAGVIVYQLNPDFKGRSLFLLLGLSLTLFLSWNAVGNFWELTETLGYVRCFPDATGCLPLPKDAPSWWVLFFKF